MTFKKGPRRVFPGALLFSALTIPPEVIGTPIMVIDWKFSQNPLHRYLEDPKININGDSIHNSRSLESSGVPIYRTVEYNRRTDGGYERV
ncbi:hypothetical protein M8J75_003164 [Diaphorina citri]|nr:hypothetical protein M8J75_003164 [Diaphorina citri]